MTNCSHTSALRLAAVAVVVAAAAVGCGQQSGGPTFSAQDLESASEFQRRLFSDGEISADEYRQAVMAQRDCVAEAGYETTPIVAAGSSLTFDATADYSDAADPEEEDRQFLATMQKCSDDYVKFVGYAWSSSQVVADGPKRDQMRREMAQCVTDAGGDMELDVTEQDLLPALEAALGVASEQETQLIQDCVSEFGDLFLAEPDQ